MPFSLNIKTFLTMVFVKEKQRVDDNPQPPSFNPDAPCPRTQHFVRLAAEDCVHELVDGDGDVEQIRFHGSKLWLSGSGLLN